MNIKQGLSIPCKPSFLGLQKWDYSVSLDQLWPDALPAAASYSYGCQRESNQVHWANVQRLKSLSHRCSLLVNINHGM